MKNTKRLQLWGNNTFKKLFKVDKITQLTDLYNQQKQQLEDIKNKLYESKGSEEFYQSELEKINSLLLDLNKCAKKVKDDDVQLREVYNHKVSLENKKKVYEDFIKVQSPITEKYSILKNEIENKTNKLKDKIDEIKMKKEFAKSVNNFNDIQSTSSDINIDDIIKDVQIDFNASCMKLDDIKTIDIDNIIQDSGFDEFKKGIK